MKSFIQALSLILVSLGAFTPAHASEEIIDPRMVEAALEIPFSSSADLSRASLLIRQANRVLLKVPFSEIKSSGTFTYEISRGGQIKVYFVENSDDGKTRIKTLMGDQKLEGAWFEPIPLCSLMNESRLCFVQLARDETSKSFSIQILKK